MSESTQAPPSTEAVAQMHSAYASVTQPTLNRFEALINELLHTQKALEAAMLREQAQVSDKLAPRITKIEATMCKLPGCVDKVARIRQQMALIGRRMQTIVARKQDIINEMSDAQRTEYKALLNQPSAPHVKPELL